MGAVWLRASAHVRRRLAATALLAVLVGIAGGAVLTAVAAAGRGRDALPEFLAYHRPADATVGIEPDLPPAEAAEIATGVLDLPAVEAGGFFGYPLFARIVDGRPQLPPDGTMICYGTIAGAPLRALDRPLLLDGRFPDDDEPSEIAVNEEFLDRFDAGVGDSLRFAAYGREQVEAVGNAEPVTPTGPRVDLTVTGVFRRPSDLSIMPVEDGTLFEVNATAALLTSAFWERHGTDVASYPPVVTVRLADGVATEDLGRGVTAISPRTEVFTDNSELAGVPSVRRAIDRQSNGLLVFAAVTAVAAVVLVGQALARQVASDATEVPALRALGFTRSQVVGVTLLRVAPVALIGAASAVAIAIVASTATPFGLAGRAEVDGGVEVDGAVMAWGAAAIVGVVFARTAVSGWLAARRGTVAAQAAVVERASRTVDRLASAGAPPPALAGVRMALEPGRGRTAVSVRAAFAGGIVAVAAVAGALTYGASLDHLLTDRTAWGWDWDVIVGNYSERETAAEAAALLAANDDVEAFSGRNGDEGTVDGVGVTVAGFTSDNGLVAPPVVEGRLPGAAGEVALGPATLEDIGKEVGDRVVVAGLSDRTSATVVGTVIGPATSIEDPLGEGALVTFDVYRQITGPPFDFPLEYSVRLREAVDRTAAIDRLRDDFRGTVRQDGRGIQLETLNETRPIPYVLAALIGTLGAATVGHGLVTAVRRRRRDLAVLKTMGFVRAQVGATVAWQATTFAAVALVVGIPIGIAAGRGLWRADVDLGTPVADVVPLGTFLLGVPVVFLVANAIAAFPARAAARIRPAVALRSE